MKLARVNTLLLIAILLINGYVILLPFLPSILYLQDEHSPKAQAITKQATTDAPSSPAVAADAEQLLIPAMVFSEAVHEGKDMRVLREGLWRLPYTSTPDKGGNTVIVGHRFTYTNPHGTLYHLDKVHVGDPIALLWHGKKYQYSVTEVKEVRPSQVEVEAPTKDPHLTIYTCTPLWNPKDRLVVVAKLEHVYE